MTFKTVEQELKPILEKYESTRGDDMNLYVKYVNSRGGDIGKTLCDRKYRLSRGLASYDTVSRIRRKIQAENAGLRPSKEYIEKRKKAEAEYKKYAKEKGGGVNE